LSFIKRSSFGTTIGRVFRTPKKAVWLFFILTICSSGILRSQSVLGFERLELDSRDRLSLGFTIIPDKNIRNSSDEFGMRSASLRAGIPLYRNRQPVAGTFQIRGLSATADFSLVKPSLSFLSQEHTFYTARVGIVTHFQVFKIPLSFNIGAGAADDGKFSAPKLRFSGHLVGSYDASPTLKLIYGLSYSYNFTKGMLIPILGVRWRFDSKWDLAAVLPFSLRFVNFVNRDVRWGIGLHADGNRFRLAGDSSLSGETGTFYLRLLQLSLDADLSYRFSRDLMIRGNVGLLFGRTIRIGTDVNDVYSERVNPGGFIGVSLHWMFGEDKGLIY
jgi:hypothetical protein